MRYQRTFSAASPFFWPRQNLNSARIRARVSAFNKSHCRCHAISRPCQSSRNFSMVRSVDLVAVRCQQFALMRPDARLPELAHVGVDAGQHEGVPDADNVKQCAAETRFAPGHALNRRTKRSRRESVAFIGRGNFLSDEPYEMGPSGTSTKKGNQNLKRFGASATLVRAWSLAFFTKLG
jgi:hypothetical protein